MFTGALAASFYGTPRTTMDVDVVVRVAGEKAQGRLVSALEQAKLQVHEGKISSAFKSGYNIVTFKDSNTPFSVDIMLSTAKLKKRAGTILTLQTFFQTPEDLISAKLRMIKVTIPRKKALKDEDDVKAILKFTKVNMNAIKRQAQKDNTLSILQALITGSTYKGK